MTPFRAGAITILILSLVSSAVAGNAPQFGFLIAGERVAFDGNGAPRFTPAQEQASSAGVRGGMTLWAATEEGRAAIRRFDVPEYRIIVTESSTERGVGRAPQPGPAEFIEAGDASKTKTYGVILNPTIEPRFEPARGTHVEKASFAPPVPRLPEEVMAAAWAAEMLHVSFYADGIQLPHHWRNDFQQRWSRVAAELGFPGLPHGDDGGDEMPAPRRITRWH